jgi:hypothetical protein
MDVSIESDSQDEQSSEFREGREFSSDCDNDSSSDDDENENTSDDDENDSSSDDDENENTSDDDENDSSSDDDENENTSDDENENTSDDDENENTSDDNDSDAMDISSDDNHEYNFEWNYCIPKRKLKSFNGTSNVSHRKRSNLLPIDFFKLLFTEQLFELIWKQTNIYGTQRYGTNWIPVELSEIKK